jgi:phospholipid-binding lipoprotein MlaA
MFTFNQTVDDKVLKPVATGYVNVIPDLIRTAIGNFFGNIGDVWTAVNNYLQGKPREGTSDVARVVLNSTFGIVGLIDVATPAGLVQHEEDFGQTLGVWGVKSGPYLVLPILGASTVRDGLARPVDLYVDPINQIDTIRVRNSARALRLVDDRAALLDSTRMMEDAALDPYLFVRDAYLQRRESRVRDGKSD